MQHDDAELYGFDATQATSTNYGTYLQIPGGSCGTSTTTTSSKTTSTTPHTTTTTSKSSTTTSKSSTTTSKTTSSTTSSTGGPQQTHYGQVSLVPCFRSGEADVVAVRRDWIYWSDGVRGTLQMHILQRVLQSMLVMLHCDVYDVVVINMPPSSWQDRSRSHCMPSFSPT